MCYINGIKSKIYVVTWMYAVKKLDKIQYIFISENTEQIRHTKKLSQYNKPLISQQLTLNWLGRS